MSLLETTQAVFSAHATGAPTHAFRVPGRLEVFGKHTDYAGGRSLVAALPRGFVFLATGRSDGVVRVVDAHDGRTWSYVAPGAPGVPGVPDVPGVPLLSYASVVIDRLTRNFPDAWRGATIVFASDLPRAAGMSSSSALLTGLTVSLAAVWQLEVHEEWRANIRNATDLAMYCACIENGRTFGTLAGDAGVGTLGGGEDHAAILLGKADQLSAFAFAPLRHLVDVRVPDQWRFVIATSGVSASKAGAKRDDYNRLSRGVAVLLDLWNRTEARCESLAAALDSDAAAGDRLRELIRRDTPPDWTIDALERRLAHFEIEDALVPDAVRGFQCADAQAIGAIGDASQHRAELLLGNQTHETIALARSARERGAFAASSFGAGFGGSVWALIQRDDADAFAARWLALYRQRCTAGARAQAFVAPLGSGLQCTT